MQNNRYTGETDGDVYQRLDGRVTSVDRPIPRNMEANAEARATILFEAKDIFALLKNNQTTQIPDVVIERMFSSMVEAAPVATQQSNPALTMPQSEIDRGIEQLEKQFTPVNPADGLEEAMTIDELRRRFEVPQNA